MRHIRFAWLFLLAGMMLIQACRKDDLYYGVNPVDALPENPTKDKLKNNSQYLAVLHANLFQTAISANEMVEIGRVVRGIGDKGLAYELVVSSFMNKPGVILPTESEMRADPEAFITETYIRFFVRKPLPIEKAWFIEYLDANPDVTPELVYLAFAISDEYFYY